MSKVPESQKVKQYDILCHPETFDAPILKDGDFVIDEDCTDQHTAHILIGQKGDFRYDPVRGVGLIDFLQGNGNEDTLLNEIQTQILGDGMRLIQLEIIEKGVQVQSYKPKL